MMVEPGNTTLRRMLLDEITPVVMVLSTPLVEDSCRKNGRSLIELLTPFCNFNNIDVPVRTASDQPYRVRKFKLRLFYASELRQRNIEVTKERLKQVITEASDREVYELCSDPPEIKSVIETPEQAAEPSWFQTFNRELVNTASFSEHEAFDHPVACLVVVSSKDKDPINKFVELFNTNQLPSLLKDGSMDPKILKYFWLVHDNQDGILENSTGILTELRSAFGSNDCRLLYINSSVDAVEEQQDSPWASYENGVSHDQRSAAFLNGDDIDELRSTMQDIASKHIIPHMEMKIRLLNQQVSATRRGIKNQFKNLLWRKGKDDAPENPSGPMYTFSSTESQIRVLGDYAFMLRDYELALSNYRLISTDYKLDKAWKRYAGVQEMMGLAYFMLDHSRKEAEYCMENAFSTYLKIGSAGARNATRCGLWWTEMLKARDQYKDAAGVFFRISGEEPLHSAVMVEQASYCYLLSRPTMSRKYGFHLVLSGELYSKCDQIKHAIRTYRVALSVFKGTSWSRIRDHVHFHIGKWYALLGMFDKAIQHMVEVLSCGHQSRLTQELFLKDIFKTIQESGKTFEVLRLQLPVISLPSIKVVFEDHRTYASPAAASVRESLWQSLEAEMFQSLSVTKTNWLDSQPTVLPKKYKDSNICVAGEAIKVDLGFRNPLQIPISITNVSLICEHSVDPDETGSDVSGSLIDHHNTEELKIVSVSGDFNLDTSLFALSEVDISMQGGDSTLVQLTVTPKIEGILKVVGIRWKLKGSVVGVKNFNAEVRKKTVKGKRKLKQPTDNKLEFLVIKTLPRLEGVIKDFPTAVYAGDLRRLVLELKNPSKISVKNLKMRVSHPRFLSVANLEAMNSEFPTCLRKQGDGPHNCKPAGSSEASNNVFVFPETTSVSADVPLVWPLWFRAAYSGNITLCITIYYEMEDRSATITHRTLRMVYNLEVLPCLEMSFQISPCPFRGKEFLVQMDVINRTSSETFQIHQISCLREQWELALLNDADYVDPLGLVSAGQALSYFFKLKKRKKQANAEDNTFSSVIASGSADVRLADSDSTGFFDVSVPPLILFHHHEQLIQERVEQDDQNTVDFILMSESQRNIDSGLRRSSEVYCHYKCHCSVATTSPISWLVNSPRTIKHDFSSGFCEVPFTITVHNSSKSTLSLHLKTFDSTPHVNDSNSSNSLVAETEVGWHDLSHLTELKVTTDASKSVPRKALQEVSSSFIWSGSSSTRIKIDPLTSGEIPLLICVFSPGTLDVSNYVLQWDVVPSTEEGESVSSGTCQGSSRHITVLQKD